MAGSLPRDDNRVPIQGGLSSIDGITPTPFKVNPVTGALVIEGSVSTDGGGVGSYQVNDMDDGDTAANVLYVGLEDKDGAWCVFVFDETTATLPEKQYATITNNPTTTTYSTAWTNRASLTYQDYKDAF